MESAEIKALFKQYPYLSLPDFLQFSMIRDDVIDYINGCGASSGTFSDISPNTIDGICILPACIIHDVRYYRGQNIDDKIYADLELLENLNKILMNADDVTVISPERRQLRLDEAMTIFTFVHQYGLKSFAEGKNIVVRKVPFIEQLVINLNLIVKVCLIPVKLIYNTVLVKMRLRHKWQQCSTQ